MKILKEGDGVPRDVIVCCTCKTEFQFDEEDVFARTSTTLGRLPGFGYFYCECPHCGKEHQLSHQKLGTETYNRLKKTRPPFLDYPPLPPTPRFL